MALLAGTHYDPAAAVTKSMASLLAMTAMDTTNLRLTFTVPANGSVLVRLRGVIHGSSSLPQYFFGILEGASIKARVAPVMGVKDFTVNATDQITSEALFTVSGLTPGASLTWDAAYAVDINVASTGIKYGGPNNTTTNDAFGGFAFEIWEAPNLLASTIYDPTGGAMVTKSVATLIAMTALDTTNLRLTFTAPSSGKVMVRLKTLTRGPTTAAVILLGILDGSTVKFRQSPIGGCLNTAGVSARYLFEASGLVTGLTGGTSYTWDAAYGVEIVGAASNDLVYGGPDNTTLNDAGGGFAYEIWAA